MLEEVALSQCRLKHVLIGDFTDSEHGAKSSGRSGMQHAEVKIRTEMSSEAAILSPKKGVYINNINIIIIFIRLFYTPLDLNLAAKQPISDQTDAKFEFYVKFCYF